MGLSRERYDITETTGTIHYDTIFNINLPSDSFDHNISYFGKICGINVYNFKGSVTVFGLKEGQKYSYGNNYIECTYSYKYYETQYGTDETGNSISWEELKSGNGSIRHELEDIDIYTHPGSFSMDAVSAQQYPNDSNSIIANVLNSKVINDKWIPRFQAAYRWYNQDDTSYDPANITYDYFSGSNNGGMKVKQNDPISAAWFNNCMEGMRQFGKSVEDADKNELITARLINQMNFTGTS